MSSPPQRGCFLRGASHLQGWTPAVGVFSERGGDPVPAGTSLRVADRPGFALGSPVWRTCMLATSSAGSRECPRGTLLWVAFWGRCVFTYFGASLSWSPRALRLTYPVVVAGRARSSVVPSDPGGPRSPGPSWLSVHCRPALRWQPEGCGA